MHRGSAYYRGRESVAIVQETRGVPLQLFSFLTGLFCIPFGLRGIFFCDYPLVPGEEDVLTAFEGCRNDVALQTISGIGGIYCLNMAYLRLQVAMAKHVADLYNTMALLVFNDFLLVIMIAHTGILKEGTPYLILPIVASSIYELHVLTVARKALISRKKMIKIAPAYDSVPDHDDDRKKEE